MEKQRIDANTIRVLITQDDLDARGITMLDLLGSQKQIEDFFYSILAEVDTEHQFHKNDAVTFQALPTKRGLELLISKTNSTENSQENDEQSKVFGRELASHDAKRRRQNTQATSETHKAKVDPAAEMVFEFKSFEDFVELARAVDADGYRSDLYIYNSHFYLAIRNVEGNTAADEVLDMASMINEFGRQVSLGTDILLEHGKQLMHQSALETTAYYFKD